MGMLERAKRRAAKSGKSVHEEITNVATDYLVVYVGCIFIAAMVFAVLCSRPTVRVQQDPTRLEAIQQYCKRYGKLQFVDDCVQDRARRNFIRGF